MRAFVAVALLALAGCGSSDTGSSEDQQLNEAAASIDINATAPDIDDAGQNGDQAQ